MHPPLACVPGAIPADERTAHFALIRRLFTSGELARERVPGGYRFRFSTEAIREVARFVENERRCCPFLTFTMTVGGEEMWLQLTGPEGTTAFLDAELSLDPETLT